MSPSRLRRSQRRARRTAARAALRPKLGEQLLHVWEHARWVFANFCEFFAAPAAIAAREYIAVPHYRAMESWLRSLELLTRVVAGPPLMRQVSSRHFPLNGAVR